MALSNWDTFCMNEKGESVPGKFVTPKGVTVEMYKNWAYIYPPGKQFGDGESIRFRCGSIEYMDLEVFAVTGRKDGIYLCAHTGYEHNKDLKGIVAIGIYGYEESEWVGIRKAEIDELKKILNQAEASEDHNAFIPEVFIQMDFMTGKRFNQGDKYFADRLGFEIPATTPGEAEPTIMSQALKEHKHDEETS